MLIVTVSHRTSSGICPVNFSLCLTKLILTAMYIGNAFGRMSEHFQWLTMSTEVLGHRYREISSKLRE